MFSLLVLGFALPARADTFPPVFEAQPCEGVPPGYAAECGDLVVLENRAQPQGRPIRLAVVILKAQVAAPAPDPLLAPDNRAIGERLSSGSAWRG